MTARLAYHPIFTRLVGQIVALWPHIDEGMVHVFRELLGVTDETPVRAAFLSIVNAQARVRVLRNLLRQSRANATKGAAFDELIDEYVALNDLRNTYVHGLWSIRKTAEEGEGMYLSSPVLDDANPPHHRPVSPEELQAAADRMLQLLNCLREFRKDQRARHRSKGQPLASRGRPDGAP